jgi:hypothetical protein
MLNIVTFTINIPQMLTYIPAPWILWASDFPTFPAGRFRRTGPSPIAPAVAGFWVGPTLEEQATVKCWDGEKSTRTSKMDHRAIGSTKSLWFYGVNAW